eukprot:scaffold12465_cov119-Isochrysis_galbana.AAC.7
MPKRRLALPRSTGCDTQISLGRCGRGQEYCCSLLARGRCGSSGTLKRVRVVQIPVTLSVSNSLRLYSRIEYLPPSFTRYPHKNMLRPQKRGCARCSGSRNPILAPREDVPLAIGSLLTILWKYTLISWYQVDIDHKAFIKDTVWGQSIRRFADSDC